MGPFDAIRLSSFIKSLTDFTPYLLKCVVYRWGLSTLWKWLQLRIGIEEGL